MWTIILILTGIGIACGVLIWVTNKVLPKEPESLKTAEEVSEKLPGMNCGACGYPGCFAYAQAIAKDKNVFLTNTCTTVLQDSKILSELEQNLGLNIDKSSMDKKAIVCCGSDSEAISDYFGVKTCKASSKILMGFKKCPYGCLSFGDCVPVCPQDAIKIDEKRKIAVIDPNKCNGCGLCVKECPRNIIKLVPSNSKIVFLCSYDNLRDIPGREKCDFGCTHCRKCFKACEHEAIIWNKDKQIPEFDQDKCTDCGACIEACPNNTLARLWAEPKEKKEDQKEKLKEKAVI